MSVAYLHVGPVKTGSTYLQDLLWRQRDELARQGMLLPIEYANEMWPAVNDVQDCSFVHFDMPEAVGAWQRVMRRVHAHPGPSLLSHEVLGHSRQEHVRRVVQSLQPAEPVVVVMARSLAATLPSLWQETVKMADPGIGWPDFLIEQQATGAPSSDTTAIVATWSACVPVDRIHVVTVPPSGSSRRVLLERFCEAVGLDATRLLVEMGKANASLDAVQTELIRRLTRATRGDLDVRAQRRLVNAAVLPRLRAAQAARALRVPATLRRWVEAETERRIAAIRAGGAVLHGDLDDLHAGDEAYAEDAGRAISERELLDEALALVATLVDDVPPGLDMI
ncbi:MAG: hypothetical protein M3419_03015 [Actinomycetota bacterium]|nr:hypothetical protein [Actinomycetota bacterium]